MYAWPGSGVSPSHSSTPTMEVTGSESVLIDDVAYINSKCVCVWIWTHFRLLSIRGTTVHASFLSFLLPLYHTHFLIIANEYCIPPTYNCMLHTPTHTHTTHTHTHHPHIDEIGLHRVENPSHTDQAVTLHLYCPPITTCQSFEARTGRSHSCHVTFYSKEGQKVCSSVK